MLMKTRKAQIKLAQTGTGLVLETILWLHEHMVDPILSHGCQAWAPLGVGKEIQNYGIYECQWKKRTERGERKEKLPALHIGYRPGLLSVGHTRRPRFSTIVPGNILPVLKIPGGRVNRFITWSYVSNRKNISGTRVMMGGTEA